MNVEEIPRLKASRRWKAKRERSATNSTNNRSIGPNPGAVVKMCRQFLVDIAKGLHEVEMLALLWIPFKKYIGSINCGNGPLQDQGGSAVAKEWQPTGRWTVLRKPASAGFLMSAEKFDPYAPFPLPLSRYIPSSAALETTLSTKCYRQMEFPALAPFTVPTTPESRTGPAGQAMRKLLWM
ncbi:hypothetical protein [Pseudomonas bohemica]|uniref:hypothetical protein n=1 Tax=Pseudomonas bohemica TaxID=2044872 RepID=UPI0018FEBAED|nr:hypothetical protein [Pseudomonas bohemica]